MPLLLLIAVAAAGCGREDRQAERGSDAFSAVERRTAEIRVGSHAAPRWEPLATLRGPTRGSREFSVARRALQWRVRWRCGGARLRIIVNGRRLRDGRCRPGSKPSIGHGPIKLSAEGSGAWSVVAEQEVDTALREPPLPDMRARGARRLARGSFYPIERRGAGAASLHRLPQGRLALRLEGLNTSANTDLFVWVSRARRPRTTRQALAAAHLQVRALKSTLGDQNYLLPRGFDASGARSVVIWCEPVQIAYTAAALER